MADLPAETLKTFRMFRKRELLKAEMRQIFLLFLFIAMALLCGAVLSFPLFWFVQLFSDVPFHKVTSQLSSLFGLFFIFLYLKFNHILNRNTAGYHLEGTSIKSDMATGAGLGIAIMLVLIIIYLLLGIHGPEPELQLSLMFLIKLLIKAFLTGVVVALLEETLYRGALFGGLSRTTNVITAIIFSSVIYSAVHFIKYPQLPADVVPGWSTGLQLLAGAFHRFQDPAIIDSFLALFAFGVLLAQVRLHKGNIIQCMGIHAGVVMAMIIIKEFTDYVPDNNFSYLVNRYDHLLGYMAFVWLLMIIAAYYRYTSRSHIRS